MAKSEFRVIRETQVNTPESLLTIAKGHTVTVSCKDFSPYSTVKSAATRLNQRLGKIEFEVTTPDNAATIIIKRNGYGYKDKSLLCYVYKGSQRHQWSILQCASPLCRVCQGTSM